MADKVFIHRWPHDTPVWGDSTKKQLDEYVNKKLTEKQVIVDGKEIRIEGITFKSLKKIGISIPFFKKESTMIFEGQFDGLFAHVHITTKSKDFLEIFNALIKWRQREFPESINQ